MSIYSIFNNPFDMFPMFPTKQSVYVISDSELAKYKRKQAEAELLELDKLIDGHKQSIEFLEKTKQQIQAELPELPDVINQQNDTPAFLPEGHWVVSKYNSIVTEVH